MAQGMGGALRGWSRRAEAPALRGAAALVILMATLLPFLMLAAKALATPGALARATSALLSGEVAQLWRTTLGLALAVTALALLLGVPLGLLLSRTDVPGRRAALALHLFPLFLPPFVLALGAFHLLGRGGLVGTPVTSAALFSPAGCVLLLALTFTPVVSALVALALEGLDASLEEAARLSARTGRIALRILLPLALPSAALGGLLVFALTFSELGVPMFLRVRVFSAAVFARLGGVDSVPGEALVLGLPLLVLSLLLLFLARRLFSRPLSLRGLREPKRPLPLGAWRAVLGLAVWSLVSLPLLPLAGLALRADFAGAWSWLGGSVGNTLALGAWGATLSVAAGLILGHALARGWGPAPWVQSVALLGFVTPAAVLGVGLIALWNRPATQGVYASSAILVLGVVARYSILPLALLGGAIAQGARSLEDAAAVGGAGYTRRLLAILAPLHRRALLGAWLLAFVFCVRDLDTSILFYPPGGEPLTVRLFTLEANGPPGVVAGLALVQVGLTALVVVAGWALLARRAA